MSKLVDAARQVAAQTKHWYWSVKDDGVVVQIDGVAQIIFRDQGVFTELMDSIENLARVVEEPPTPPNRRGSQIDNGFHSVYDEIMEKKGDWVSRHNLDLPTARSLKRQLRKASDRIAVATRTENGGHTVYARYVTSGK